MAAVTCTPEVPTLVLEATDQAPRLARGFLAARFAEWGIGDDYVGRLVVCELVTNACAPRGALLYPRRSREELKGGSWA